MSNANSAVQETIKRDSGAMELAKVEPENGIIAKMQERGGVLEISTIDISEPDGFMAALALDTKQPKIIFKQAPCTVKAVHITIREAEQYNKNTGEIEGKLRTIIIDSDGEIWTTNSPIVSRLVMNIMRHSAFRRKFSPPLELEFSTQKTMSGGDALVCHLSQMTLNLLGQQIQG